MSKPDWTSTLPAAPGRYGWRDHPTGRPTIRRVYESGGQLYCRADGFRYTLEQLANIFGGQWWPVPLSLPWEAGDLGHAAAVVCRHLEERAAPSGIMLDIVYAPHSGWLVQIDDNDQGACVTGGSPAAALLALAAKLEGDR